MWFNKEKEVYTLEERDGRMYFKMEFCEVKRCDKHQLRHKRMYFQTDECTFRFPVQFHVPSFGD